ncbi:MAG: GtrA family protein [Treponema sp.]|uniref:GtrA family protein n=1 Tax=Treponema sp. TaxID=166 RepID=UPI00298E2830|nr:GtrA family protein [Treponema sp.]MCR5385573.1 GtrA family protein [Treponema sp.]
MILNDLFKKYKSFIAYAFFGACTTLVNLITYKIFYFVLKTPNIPSTIIAWLLAVLFAFITNKLWVFNSKSWVASVVFPELTKFFICRIATGILDVLIMWLAVDKMKWNAMLWKLVSNIIVIILNYIASKILIFKNKDTTENKNEKQILN